MANFTTYSRLHITVVRDNEGDDNLAGGEYVIHANIVGTALSSGTLNLLGTNVSIAQGDTGAVVVTKAVTAFSSLGAGVSAAVAVKANTILAVTYLDTTIYPFPTDLTPLETNGLIINYLVVDNRDVTQTMKHSEYEDTVAGLGVATSEMFTLVANSDITDTIQLQRVSLDSTNSELQIENLTQPVSGRAYLPYVN